MITHYFTAEYYSIVYTCYIFIIHLSVHRHLVCLHSLVRVNRTVIYMTEQIFVKYDIRAFVHMPRNCLPKSRNIFYIIEPGEEIFTYHISHKPVFSKYIYCGKTIFIMSSGLITIGTPVNMNQSFIFLMCYFGFCVYLYVGMDMHVTLELVTATQ